VKRNPTYHSLGRTFLFVVICAITLRTAAQATDYKSYTLFIYNFMKYVEWPEQDSRGDFVICAVGDSPINKELQTLASHKKLRGRNIVFRQCDSPAEAGTSHLVFIPDSKSGKLKDLKEQTKGKPVLLVSEREGYARKGAGLSFVTLDDDELKFDINKKEIEQRQLKISSQLLNLGIVIN
jgi:hypothetical protein